MSLADKGSSIAPSSPQPPNGFFVFFLPTIRKAIPGRSFPPTIAKHRQFPLTKSPRIILKWAENMDQVQLRAIRECIIHSRRSTLRNCSLFCLVSCLSLPILASFFSFVRRVGSNAIPRPSPPCRFWALASSEKRCVIMAKINSKNWKALRNSVVRRRAKNKTRQGKRDRPDTLINIHLPRPTFS